MKWFRVSKKFTQQNKFRELDETEIVQANDANEALNKYLTETNRNYYAVNGRRTDDGTIPGYASFLYSIYANEDTCLEITMKED